MKTDEEEKKKRRKFTKARHAMTVGVSSRWNDTIMLYIEKASQKEDGGERKREIETGQTETKYEILVLLCVRDRNLCNKFLENSASHILRLIKFPCRTKKCLNSIAE